MTFPEWITPAPLPILDMEGRGIFCWLVGRDSYIGKSERFTRSLGGYERNVARIESAQPYRLGNEDGFRAVHKALHQAKRDGERVVWLTLELCSAEADLNQRRAFWVQQLRPSLNGVERNAGRNDHE